MHSEGYRSVIAALAGERIVDPSRVGVVVWSRSGFWLQHALAFKDDLFAAAIAADASSFGQFMYLYFHNWPSGFQGDYLRQNGARPFGDGLDQWRKRDPVTHTGAFSIPLRIEDYGEGFPSWWEPYVAMKEAGEPVEYFHLPTASHDPIQPEHRLWIQSATVDWFRFWLKGEENPNPVDTEQYVRWRKIRDERCARTDLDNASYCSVH